MPSTRDAALRETKAWLLAACPDSLDLRAAEDFCRALAGRHYENFSVASRLLPSALRQDLANVYAFARWADDLADESDGPEEALLALGDWRRRLVAASEGRPDHPVFVALAATLRRRGLPVEPFHHLLDAFEQDQFRSRYQSRADLLHYCSRSADPVGRIVLGLGGCRDPAAIAQSDSICTGLQLVNFWQDIVRDRAAGRIYVPLEEMMRHGVREEDFDRPVASECVRGLLRDLVSWARECFDAGAGLHRIAPGHLRPAIRLFLGGGRAVADAIERQGFDTLRARPLVGGVTKAWLAVRAIADRGWSGLVDGSPES
jgi:squalene synthase HpnC